MILASLFFLSVFTISIFFLSKENFQRAEELFADSFFEKHDQKSTQNDRLKEILKLGASKLGLRFAVAVLHLENGLQIMATYSSTYWHFPYNESGDLLPKEKLYCGMLKQNREAVAIDFASITEWRSHLSYKELGIESFIGFLVKDSNISISFFDTIPRDNLYSSSEKEFIRQLAGWVSSLTRGVERKELNMVNDKLHSTVQEIASEI